MTVKPAPFVLVRPRALAALAAAVLCGLPLGCSPGAPALDGGVAGGDGDVAILALTLSRSEVPAGTPVTLSWRSRNASGCELAPGFGAVPRSGSVDVTVAQATTWTLTCTGGGASASEEVTVSVFGGDAGLSDAGAADGGDGGADGGPDVVLSGAVALAPAITSFAELSDDTRAWLVRERAGQELDGELPCDLHYPGSYGDDFGSAEPACTVPAGTRVDSFLLRAIPGASAPATLVGSVELSREIVALQWRSDTLAAGDVALGLPGVSYDDPESRDYGIGSSDALTLAADRRTLSFTLAPTNVDELRVIVLADGEAPARVLSTTLQVVSAPASLLGGALESATQALFVPEQTLTLEAPLDVDIAAPGRFTDPGQLPSGTLSAGTAVKSALVHFDPPTTDGGVNALVVSGTLPAPVLGLLVHSASLAASDALFGASDTEYPDDDGRIVELGSNEVWLSDDGRSFRFDLSVGGTSSGIDEVRVLYAP